MANYRSDAVPAMQKKMIDALQTIPGVEAVASSDWPPLTQDWQPANVYKEETTDLRSINAAFQSYQFMISPDYFQAARTPLLAGRTFTWHDDINSPRVAVVNEEFARRMFGDSSTALGRYYKLRDGLLTQIVGIVENGKYASLSEDPKAAMFVPTTQLWRSQTWLLIRSKRDPSLAADIRNTLRGIDAELPLTIVTWEKELDGALFASRVATLSLGVLGFIGAILSVTGVFGMAAYAVSKRLRDFGIRMALGAPPMHILKAALARPFKLLAIGSLTGLLLGLLATKLLAYIVFQATPRDPLVLGGVVLSMALLGMLATWIPAQRALSVDPLVLLREE
jgi:ABC-type antimicrobial peptide transport system permease subunit